MTLRRYSDMKPSMGTTWPREVRDAIELRDPGCVGSYIGFGPATCYGTLQIDHVRASGGIGMKSRSTVDNGVRLCAWHHRYKTEHGREVRPLLIDYIESRADPHALHVDPCGPSCRDGIGRSHTFYPGPERDERPDTLPSWDPNVDDCGAKP